MKHRSSARDRAFRSDFEACRVPAEDFDHRAHVRLAYVYLCEHDVDAAHEAMRSALLGFLRCLGASESKYHETITRAWIKAVRHFMEATPACGCAADFIARNPSLLDADIMLEHYSAAVLFSPDARNVFIEPDVEPIPEHGD